MSERAAAIAGTTMGIICVILMGLGVYIGYHDGKHSADRWYYAHEIHGFAVYKNGTLERVEPLRTPLKLNPNEEWQYIALPPGTSATLQYPTTPVPAGIGKPQAPSVVAPKTWKYSDSVDWEDSPEWKAHQKRLREANPLKRPKTWPPDCKPPSCAPVSTEPLHWADGTYTDFFTQETIPCPLNLGKPSAKWHRTTHQECESETQREYKSMEGWATGDPAIMLGDGTFDAGTRPEQEFNKKELGKRKPASQQGGCTPEMGPGCAFINNSAQGYAVPGCNMDHACVVLTTRVPTPQVHK